MRPETDVLSPEEKDLVAGINKVLCGYSPNAVRAVLKADRAALVERHGSEDEETDGVLITLNELQSYFAKRPKVDWSETTTETMARRSEERRACVLYKI